MSPYLFDGMPRSLQILLARKSLISVCLGTEDRLFKFRFHHHECLPPSLRGWHPYFVRCARSSFLFIRIEFLRSNGTGRLQWPRCGLIPGPL